MPYLARVHELPSADHLDAADRKLLDKRFDANAYELNFDGQPVDWSLIEEIEVVKAARQGNLAGLVVRNLMFGGDRYHIGVYFGKQEIVLTNITQEVTRYIMATIGHYAPSGVRYKGETDIAMLTEE
ncbi:MAG: hypothetical protein SGJ24_02810 [Chloroflexota bacterium]|nr:hypothetical protein [Chloroflexota bacterium]